MSVVEAHEPTGEIVPYEEPPEISPEQLGKLIS